MEDKTNNKEKKLILAYLSIIVALLVNYLFQFIPYNIIILSAYWGVYYIQSSIMKKRNKVQLSIIITIILSSMTLPFIYPIYLGEDILITIFLTILICYYLLKEISKFKWIKIVAVVALIPLTLSLYEYSRKDKLIKGIKIEREIKRKLQIKNISYNEELTVKELSKIDSFWIFNNLNIYDLSGIENLKNLEELEICTRFNKNIESIGKLNNLKELSLSENTLHRLGEIKGLESLERLYLSTFRVNNGGTLNNFSGLKELTIKGAWIKDFSFINELDNLQKLTFVNCKITTMANIEALPELKEIKIENSKIKNTDKLKDSKSLKIIEIVDSKIEGLDKLQEDTDLIIFIKD